MIIKFLITIVILINLNPPFVSLVDISLICLLLLIIMSSKAMPSVQQIVKKKYKVLLIIFLITIVNLSLPRLKIEEGHSIFINDNDLKIISNFLPTSIINDMKLNLDNFDINRLLKSDSTYFNTIEKYNNAVTIKTPFAFSSDSFFQKNKFSRQVKKINFNSRENLRLGHLNTVSYKLPFDKKFRRILPYFVFFEIPSITKNSQICTKR